MNQQDVLKAIDKLRAWSRDDERAPHKPLLILLALGELARGKEDISFEDCEPKLTELLKEFGPSRSAQHPEYPFWRLQNDGIWKVTADKIMTTRKSNTDIPRTELRRHHAVGAFTHPVLAILREHPALINEIASTLLNAHFPESLHFDILEEVGLSIETPRIGRRPRDAAFRGEILRVYERRCAVCGFDLRIADHTVGVEAAHIKWHQAAGPDEVVNGLALCTIHHKLFDLGAFKLDENLKLVVSEHVTGTAQLDHILLRHHLTEIHKPLHINYQPRIEFLCWHATQVFKSPGRA